jgi:small subunit ribosomal protein S6
MLILPADADEALVTTAVDRVAKAIASTGGEVTGFDRWGRKRFAYELARQTEGYYVVVRFTAEPAAQQELDRALNLADEVIRHKVMVLPDAAKKKASPASAKA